MGKISYALKMNPHTAQLFAYLKDKKDLWLKWHSSFGVHRFINRSQGSENLCIVLAGYKERCYPATLGRIARAAHKELDICILSSGLYSPTLNEICASNGWSYLSTKRNNVSLIQNMAIEFHPNARYIFKLDEDVFVCKDYFSRMRAAYEHALTGRYRPGVIAPLLNLNGFSSYLLLEYLGLLKDFEDRFGPLYCQTGRDFPIESHPDVARYLWGDGGFVPQLDELDLMLASNPQNEVACPNVFSIGAILFKRSLWEDMGYFPVRRSGASLGQDEKRICNYCHAKSRPVMVSMNIAAGHLSFRPQNSTMMNYYLKHEEQFLPKRAN